MRGKTLTKEDIKAMGVDGERGRAVEAVKVKEYSGNIR